MFVSQKNNIISSISEKFRRKDNKLVYLFTNARDEPNIAEWVAHHLLLGFHKVYVFDHLSVEPISQKIETNFDNRLIVERVEGAGEVKINLIKKAVNIAQNADASWMLYLDADEFLCLKRGINVNQFLDIFSEADAIGINWLMFGSSGHVKQPQGLLTENFVKSDIRLNSHVKSFVRPHVVRYLWNPHFYNIIYPNRYFSGNLTRMKMGPFNNQPLPFINSVAYIAHYYTQSEEEHLRRKGRQMDDGSIGKENLIKDINIEYNAVLNNQLQFKYSENIKNFLKKYNIVL
jgi:hypothetical protein